MGREIGKALFVFDGKETMEDRVLEVIESLKKELKRVGIRSLTVEEEEKEDEKCNMAVVIITAAFLRDHFADIDALKERFRTAYCSAIVVGDPQFIDFILDATEERPHSSKLHPTYKISTINAFRTAGHIMNYSYIKYLTVDLQNFAPVDVQTFAQTAASLLNTLNINYDQLYPDTLFDLKLIDKQLQLQYHNILNHHDRHDDVVFAVLVGCQCRCYDMSSISKFLFNLNIINNRSTCFIRILSTSKIQDIHTDPLALANALVALGFPSTEIPSWRLYFTRYPRCYVILVEDLDLFGSPLARKQLKNLADILGRGSLVIVPTTFTRELAGYGYSNVHFVRETNCKEATWWRTFCFSMSKSEIYGLDTNEPEKEAEVQNPKLHQPLRNEMVVSAMDTVSFDDVVSSSSRKKPKTTSS